MFTMTKLVANRSADFAETYNYDVRDESGALIAVIFRDPENREWYEENRVGTPRTDYIERWVGSTKIEALATIARRMV